MFEEENQTMFLKFTTQVHPFPFLDSVVEVAVTLCSASGRIISGKEVGLRICLQYSDDSQSEVENAIEVLNPEALQISAKNGKSSTIRIRLLTASSNNRGFVLSVFPEARYGPKSSIAPHTSEPMQIVRNRIEIINEQEIVPVWFKDEGGKGNQIILHLRLVNAQGNTVINRSGLRLKCALFYDDGERVADQKILKISHDSSMYVGIDGLATIYCQIKEISQNHDCRKFKVMVSPDTLKTQAISDISDISHDFTPEILVKSKISKKNREKLQQKKGDSDRDSSCAVATTGRKRKCTESDAVRNISPLNMPGQTAQGGVTSIALLQFSEFTVRSLESLKQQLHVASLVAPSSPTSLSCCNPLAVIEDILQMHKTLNLPLPASSSSSEQLVSFDDAYDQVFDYSDGHSHEAMLTPTSQPMDQTVEDAFDGFQLTARGMLGPENVRENSLFLQAAGGVQGPLCATRQHSLFLPLDSK